MLPSAYIHMRGKSNITNVVLSNWQKCRFFCHKHRLMQMRSTREKLIDLLVMEKNSPFWSSSIFWPSFHDRSNWNDGMLRATSIPLRGNHFYLVNWVLNTSIDDDRCENAGVRLLLENTCYVQFSVIISVWEMQSTLNRKCARNASPTYFFFWGDGVTDVLNLKKGVLFLVDCFFLAGHHYYQLQQKVVKNHSEMQ